MYNNRMIDDKTILTKNQIIIITGVMHSGKSELLINYYQYFINNNYQCDEIIQFISDINNKNNLIQSRNSNLQPISAVSINNLNEINNHLNNKHKILIVDEIQFFTNDNIDEIFNNLKNKLDYIIIAGLNRDFHHKLFGNIHKLLYLCDKFHFLKGVCCKCLDDANYNVKLFYDDNSDGNNIDPTSTYLTVCNKCKN